MQTIAVCIWQSTKHLFQLYIGCKHTIITQVWKRLRSLCYYGLKLKRWRCKQILIKVKSESEEETGGDRCARAQQNQAQEPTWNQLIINYHGEGICLRQCRPTRTKKTLIVWMANNADIQPNLFQNPVLIFFEWHMEHLVIVTKKKKQNNRALIVNNTNTFS